MDSKSFLSALAETIRDLQAARGSDSLDVAFLGNVLRREGYDWTSHGFERLSAALAQLQADGVIRTFRNDKGVLRVASSPDSGSAGSAASQPGLAPSNLSSASLGRFRPLRPPVWFAFASAVSTGHQRQINRRTGAVWSDGQRPPGPELDWVPVVPVPEDEQRKWASEFLERPDTGGDKTALNDALQASDWYRRFPAELEKRGPVLTRAWSHLRSTRIIDHVVAWANQNNVDENLLFTSGKAFEQKRTTDAAGPAADTDLRRALLSALDRMPTRELLDLALPVRYVLEAVRPDLLR